MHAFISLCFINVFIIAFCPNKISFIVLNFETSNGGMASFCGDTSILSSPMLDNVCVSSFERVFSNLISGRLTLLSLNSVI